MKNPRLFDDRDVNLHSAAFEGPGIPTLHANKFRFGVPSSVSKKRPSTDQLYHAIHHNFTTKNHPLHCTFLKTPLKKASKTAKPRSK
jgi:hypothetical protein